MKALQVFCVSLLLSAMAGAQSGLVFSSSAEATALDYQNAWVAATHTTQSLDLIDWGAQKGNSVSVQGHEVTATPFNAYLGGIQYTPDISALISKTNLPSGSFQLFAQVAGGVATFTAGNEVALLFGGGGSYRITPNLQWSTFDIDYLRVGSKNAIQMTSGLAYYFNPQASKSLAIKRMIARRAAIKAVTATVK